MRDRPILFSGPMVRAILDGTKTQTRRVMKLQPQFDHLGDMRLPFASFYRTGHVHTWDDKGVGGQNWHAPDHPHENMFSAAIRRTAHSKPTPYGRPGDRLWVRESWQYADWTEEGEPYVRYRADDAVRFCEGAGEGESLVDVWADLSATENYSIDSKAADRRWRPSIFMPRWASRLSLTITDVRVEPLQDISEADARAEGVERSVSGYWHNYAADGPTHQSARESYRSLWDSINAKRGHSWKSNPWVWVVSFERIADAGRAA